MFIIRSLRLLLSEDDPNKGELRYEAACVLRTIIPFAVS